MKRKYRLFSIFLVLMLMVGFMPVTASASSLPYVKVSTYQDNAKAKKVLKLINKERSKRGLRTLKLDKKLTSAAVKRAAEVEIYVPMTSPHKRPNGKNAHSVNKRISGECCAEGYETPKDVVWGWMHSSSHKRLILDRSARSIGIGCVTTGGNDRVWTLEISHSKVKKKLKSTKKVHSYKKVFAKKKYLKKKYFKLKASEESLYYGDYEEDVYLAPGKKLTLKVYYSSKWNSPDSSFPYYARIAATDFKWSSSKKSVATVNKYGKVTAKKEGSVKITAKMKRYPHAKKTIWIDVVDEDDYDY